MSQHQLLRIGTGDDSPDGLREHRRDVLLLLSLAALCYLDKILLGPYAFIDFYDSLEVHFAPFRNMFRFWQEFGAFSWFPFNAGGAPAFVGQHPPYHLGVLLAGLLPLWVLSLFWNMGQMFLAGYGMLRAVRLLVNPSRPVRLFCAAAFALTWISGNVHITLAYAFPAFFAWTTDLARPDLPRSTRLLAALGLFGVTLFSFPVIALPHFPVLHLALVLFLGRHLPHFRRQVVMVFAVWTGYVLIFAPSIVSLFLYIPYAQRDWAFHYPGLAAALQDLARFVYGRLTDQHLLPLLLLGLGLIRQRRQQILLGMFAAVLLIAGVFSSDMKGLFANTFLAKMDLFFFASTLAILGSLMAALALEHYRQAERALPWQAWAACAAALTLFGSSHVVLRNLFLLAACLGLLTLLRRHCQTGTGRPARLLSGRPVSGPLATGRLIPEGWAPVLLAVGLAGLGMFTRQQYMAAGAFVPYARGFEAHPGLARLGRESTRTPFRVADVDVHPALLQAYGLDTVGGKGPLFNKQYKQLVKEAVRPQFRSPQMEAAFEDVWRQTYLTRNQGDHDQRPLALIPDRPRRAADFNLGLLRLMGVTHLISPWPVEGMEAFAPPPAIEPGRSGGLFGLGVLSGVYSMPLYDYALKDAPGLGILAGSAVLADSPGELLRLISAEPFEGLLRKVFLLRADIPADIAPQVLAALDPAAAGKTSAQTAAQTAAQTTIIAAGQAAPQVRLESWSPDRLVFSGQATGPALLLVANNFDPRWTARVNGVSAPLLRADHAFQAVLVDRAGPFRAELTFSSALIWQLHLLAALGVLLMFCGAGPRQRGGLLPLPEAPDVTPDIAPDAAPDLPSGPPEAAPVRCAFSRLALAGLAAAAFWALGFALFVLRRHPPGDLQYEAMRYALATIPLIGVAVSLWAGALFRRL